MKFFLIDGNSLLHRAYHALPPFKTSKGELTNAVYGFISMLLSILIKEHPDYIAVAWDMPGKTFRHEAYEAYKATRVHAPQEFYDQIPRAHALVSAFKIPEFGKEGYEADDMIGTLAAQAKKSGQDLQTYIVTADKDFLQLVDEDTFVYFPANAQGESVVYDEKKTEEKYGLKPRQMIDFKSLRGDPSDNIEGVKGIGEKTAAELLQKFGTLENIYANLHEIKGAVKQKLESGRDSAFLSKKLVTILRDAPAKLDLEKCKTHTYDRQRITDLFEELEFKKLFSRLNEFERQYAGEIIKEKGIQPSLF